MLRHAVATLSILMILVIVTVARTDRANAASTGRACSPATAQASPILVEAPTLIALPKPEAPPPVAKLGTEVVDATLTMEVSGYTSEKGQTDSRPCEAADQSDICRRKAKGELICASNVFPFGTRLHVDGLGTCTVADRMNSRYTNHVDWYFGQDSEDDNTRLRRARKIGRRDRTVTVISIPE